MKISEIIRTMETTLQLHWDLEVVVQYRDAWWSYHWTEAPEMTIEWKTLIL